MGGDIALVWDSTVGVADLGIDTDDFVADGGLETAVLLSLFTDRRAESDDALPDGTTDRRGWWADAVPVVAGDKFGSRLWLLSRSKELQEVLTRAEEYAREALQWLVDDKVAERIDVESEIVGRGIVRLTISIYRPAADAVRYRYDYTWTAQEARRA